MSYGNNDGYQGQNHHTGPYFNGNFNGNYVNGNNVNHNYSPGTNVSNVGSIQNANFGTNHGIINQGGGNTQGSQPSPPMRPYPPYPYQGGLHPPNSYGPPPGPHAYQDPQPQRPVPPQRAHTVPQSQSHSYNEGCDPQQPQPNYETNPYLRLQQAQPPRADQPVPHGYNEAYGSQQHEPNPYPQQQGQHPRKPRKARTQWQPRSHDHKEANCPQPHDEEYTDEPEPQDHDYDNRQPPPQSRDAWGAAAAAIHGHGGQPDPEDGYDHPVSPSGPQQQQKKRKRKARPYVNDPLPQVEEEYTADDDNDNADPTRQVQKDMSKLHISSPLPPPRRSTNPFLQWTDPTNQGN